MKFIFIFFAIFLGIHVQYAMAENAIAESATWIGNKPNDPEPKPRLISMKVNCNGTEGVIYHYYGMAKGTIKYPKTGDSVSTYFAVTMSAKLNGEIPNDLSEIELKTPKDGKVGDTESRFVSTKDMNSKATGDFVNQMSYKNTLKGDSKWNLKSPVLASVELTCPDGSKMKTSYYRAMATMYDSQTIEPIACPAHYFSKPPTSQECLEKFKSEKTQLVSLDKYPKPKSSVVTNTRPHVPREATFASQPTPRHGSRGLRGSGGNRGLRDKEK